jgi:hypothetical protein
MTEYEVVLRHKRSGEEHTIRVKETSEQRAGWAATDAWAAMNGRIPGDMTNSIITEVISVKEVS